jgi:predicted nucleic acid-binding protein
MQIFANQSISAFRSKVLNRDRENTMTKVLHIDTLPTLHLPADSYLAFDTNILIQLADDQHEHHRNTAAVIQAVHQRTRVRFVYFIASKLELQEYMRRSFFSRGLREKFHDQSHIGGKGRADAFINDWVHNHAHDPRAVLNDYEIKSLRELCLLDHPGDSRTAISRWKQVCQLCLGRLPRVEETLARWGIQYVNIMDPALYGEKSQKPQWENQSKLMATYGLGSADAAILNMAMSTDKIVGIVTNDGDMIELFRSEVLPDRVCCFTFLRKFIDHRAA